LYCNGLTKGQTQQQQSVQRFVQGVARPIFCMACAVADIPCYPALTGMIYRELLQKFQNPQKLVV